MEEHKFCKFCGEKINKDCIVCPKCGRQIAKVPTKEETAGKSEEKSIPPKKVFYQEKWFMWIMLFVCPPIGIFFMWKFNSDMKKNTKIILTIVFGLLFIIWTVNLGNDSNNTSNYKFDSETKVTVADFSGMDRDSINAWCSDNKINCTIIDEYSDTFEKGQFISQSVGTNSIIHGGDRIKIIFSLGKKPPLEYTNALRKAESYSNSLHMSKQAIYKQLTSEYGEQFSADAAQYAIDNIDADWNANALAKAKSYQNSLHMSKNAIYDQLISEYGEQFTPEEAQYAIDHLDE